MKVTIKNLFFALSMAEAMQLATANPTATVLVTDHTKNMRDFSETANNAARIEETMSNDCFMNALSVYETSEKNIYTVFSGYGRATWLMHKVGVQTDLILQQVTAFPVLDKIKPVKNAEKFTFTVEATVFAQPTNEVEALKQGLLANSTQELSVYSSEKALLMYKSACIAEAAKMLVGKTEPLDLISRLYGINKKAQKAYLTDGNEMNVSDTFAITSTGLYGGLLTSRNAALLALKQANTATEQVAKYTELVTAVQTAVNDGKNDIDNEQLKSLYSTDLIQTIFAAVRIGKTTNISSFSTDSEEMSDSIIRVAFIGTEILALSYYTKLRQSTHTAITILSELNKFVDESVRTKYELYSKLYIKGTKTAGKITAKDLDKILPTSAEAIALGKAKEEAEKYNKMRFDANSTYFQKLNDTFIKVNEGTDAAPKFVSYLTKKEVLAICEAGKRDYEVYTNEFKGKTPQVDTAIVGGTNIDYIIDEQILSTYGYEQTIDGMKLKAEFSHTIAEIYDVLQIWNDCTTAFTRCKEIQTLEAAILAGEEFDVETLTSFLTTDDKIYLMELIDTLKAKAAAAAEKQAAKAQDSKFNTKYFERVAAKLEKAAKGASVEANDIVTFMLITMAKAVNSDGIDTAKIIETLSLSKDAAKFATYVTNTIEALHNTETTDITDSSELSF